MSENSIGSGADAIQSLLLLQTPVDRKSSTSSALPVGNKVTVIKSADMKRDWQKEAVDLAISYGVEKDIVEQIKKEFENKYGPTWHCFVGKNFEHFVDAAKEANAKAQADIVAKQTVLKGHRYKMVAKRKGFTSLSQREDEKKKVRLVAELGLFDVNDEEDDDEAPLRFSRSKKASRVFEHPPPPSTASPQAENPRFSTNAPNSTAPQQTTSHDQPHHAIIVQSEYEAHLHRIPTKLASRAGALEHPPSQSTAPSQAESPRFPTNAPNSTPIAHSQPQHATLVQSQPTSPIQTTSPQQKRTSLTPSVDYLKTHSPNDPKIKIVNPSESVYDHVGGHDNEDKSSSGAEFVHSVHSPTNKDPPPPQQNQPLNPQNTNPQPHSSTPQTATHIPIFGLTSPSSNPASSIDINQVLIALQANQQQQLALQVQMVQLVASQQALQGQFDAFSTRLMAIMNETLTKANLAVAMTNLEARVQELGDRVLANTSSKEYQSSRIEDLIARLTAVEQVVDEVAKKVTKKKIFKIVEDTASD